MDKKVLKEKGRVNDSKVPIHESWKHIKHTQNIIKIVDNTDVMPSMQHNLKQPAAMIILAYARSNPSLLPA